ncbi:MAG: hypothetical protein DRP87_17830, partial [Spirochaetes bacterium]
MKRIAACLLLSFLVLPAAYSEQVNIELRASRYAYSPNIITVNKGDVVVLTLICEDVSHGFYLDGYDIIAEAHPGEPRDIVIRANTAGKFVFRCSLTCGEFHPYMVGYLMVLPNTRSYAGISVAAVIAIGSMIFTFVRRMGGKGGAGSNSGSSDPSTGKEAPPKGSSGGQRQSTGSSEKLLGIIPLNWRFELTKYKPVRRLFKSRWFPLVFILVNLFIFTIILVATFVGGISAGNYNFGIMIVWILWWVLLMLVMVPGFGRFRCMICPFPLFGDWIQRGKLLTVGSLKSRGRAKRWPKQLRNMWPLTILFFVATFFSGFFTVRPIATFILLSVIIGAATIVAIIYEKRTFCLY